MPPPQRRRAPRSSSEPGRSRSPKQKHPGTPLELGASYHKLAGELKKLKAEWETFTSRDLPSWEGWVKAQFGPERSQLAEMEEERQRIHFRLQQVAILTSMGICKSRQAAYREVLREERQNPETGSEDDLEMDDFELDDDEEGPWDDAPASLEDLENDPDADWAFEILLDRYLEEVRGIDPDSLDEEDYRKAKEHFLESFKHAQKGNRSGFETALFQIGADSSEENVRQVKQLYRTLAKLLHPDQNPEAGALEKALWEETQAAYQATDAAALETILLRFRLERGEPLDGGDAKLLKNLIQDWTRERNALRSDLREAKKDPAWRFTLLSTAELDILACNLRHEIQVQMERLTGLLKRMRKEEELLAKPQRPRRTSGNSPKASAPPPKRGNLRASSRSDQLEMPF